KESLSCDGFIKWIPIFDIENIKLLEQGGYSKIYSGIWKPFKSKNKFNNKQKLPSLNVILKVLKNSQDLNDKFLNEKCLGVCVIPFYGLTKHLETSEYVMIMKQATQGDLRNFICSHKSKISWEKRAIILVNIAKSLNSLHKLDIIYRDFHSRNILIDDNMKVFISDFGLSGPVNLQIAFFTPPFMDRSHDIHLAIDIVSKDVRPLIIDGNKIPKFYESIMKQCWNNDLLKRPNSSQLVSKFNKIIGLSKRYDSNKAIYKESNAVKINGLSFMQENASTSKVQKSPKDELEAVDEDYQTWEIEFNLYLSEYLCHIDLSSEFKFKRFFPFKRYSPPDIDLPLHKPQHSFEDFDDNYADNYEIDKRYTTQKYKFTYN
ncbi:22530_t:CDS:2, partial [Dentiscutata erythropus]